MAELTIQITSTGEIPVMGLSGELDAYHAPRVKAELEELLASGKKTVVVNLKRVAYIDSTGLGVLVAARKQVLDAGGALLLVILSESAVQRTFTITGLLGVFSIFEEEAAALDAAAS
ncbi:STAS domain-containing protein [Armatimonas sp.]|uniref:STAS domain-containing protein n=1 Tax=Armatimonas sp. TaxID=1872638 RepID=UPI00286B4AEA|nr:STAS domain-containing protein [Armatimonas sp.]